MTIESDDVGEKVVWPGHFPTCCPCPPDDSVNLGGVLYHLAFVPSHPEDFKSAMERNRYKNLTACERCSLSCWTETEFLTEVLLPLPLHEGKTILKAQLQPNDGKMKLAPLHAERGHRSVWFCASTHQRLAEIFQP